MEHADARQAHTYISKGAAGLFLEADVSHWAAVCSVNYLGVVHTLKAGVPGMVARGAGRVLVINSTGGFMGAPLMLYPQMVCDTTRASSGMA